MSSLQKIAALLLVIAFVFLAGCVRQHKVEYGNGVVIKELSVEPNVIEAMPGARVIVTLTVQNLGEVDAKNVEAELLGLTDDTGWTLNSLPRSKPIGDGTLYAAKPSLGINEGEQGVVTWELIPPKEKATQTTYPFSVKVTYDYSTIAEGIVKVVSLEYYLRTKDSGGLQSFSYTKGPLKISVSSSSAIFSSKSQIRSVPITFQIENIGGGTPYIVDNEKKLNYVELTPTSKRLTCSPREIRFSNGKTASVTCTIQVDPNTLEYENIEFKIKLDYSYVIEKAASVTVLPSVTSSSSSSRAPIPSKIPSKTHPLPI